MGLSRGLSVVSAIFDVCPRARLEVANSNCAAAAMINPDFHLFIAGSLPRVHSEAGVAASAVQCTLPQMLVLCNRLFSTGSGCETVNHKGHKGTRRKGLKPKAFVILRVLGGSRFCG